MRIIRTVALLLIGALFFLAACGVPADKAPSGAAPAETPAAPATPTMRPADFVISDLYIDPRMPEPDQNVKVSVNVTNTGGQPGTYTVVLRVDGNIANTQDVTLPGGASQTVNLSIKAGQIGKYNISIDQLTITMEVVMWFG